MPQQSQISSFIVLIVAQRRRACLHVWTRGLGCFAGGVGLVGCPTRGSVFVCQ